MSFPSFNELPGSPMLSGLVIANTTSAPTSIKLNLVATANPVVGNDGTQGYAVGSLWLNASSGQYFICSNNSTGAAVWEAFTLAVPVYPKIGAVGKRAYVSAAGASATFYADEIVVETAINGTAFKSSLSGGQAINLATTGANGMDTGTAPASGFVSIYAIYNPTTPTTALLACNSTTSTAPVYSGAHLPTGYTASALIAVWPTNGSSLFVVGSLLGNRLNIVPI